MYLMADKKKSTAKKRSSSRSKSNTKRSSSSKRRNSRKKSSALEDQGFWIDVALFAVSGLAVLLFLCNFGILGTVGNAVSGALFGIFGLVNYIFPILFIASVLFIFANYSNRTAICKCVCVYVLYLLLAAFIAIINYTQNGDAAVTPGECFTYAFTNHRGGGFFGGAIGGLMVKAFGAVGSFFVLVLLMAILIFIIVERTPIKALGRGISKIRDSISDSFNQNYDYEEDEDDDDDDDEEFERRQKKRRRDRVVPEEITLPEDKNDEITRKGASADKPKRRSERKAVGVTSETDLTPVSERVRIHNGEDMTEIRHTGGSKVAVNASSDAGISTAMDINVRPTPKNSSSDAKMHQIKPSVKPNTVTTDSSYSNLEDAIESNYGTLDTATTEAADTTVFKTVQTVKPEITVNKIAPVSSVEAATPNAETVMPETIQKPTTAEIKKQNTAGQQGIDDIASEIAQKNTAPKPKKPRKYIPPSIELLKLAKPAAKDSSETLYETAAKLEKTLKNFGIEAAVTDISQGPSVTRYEVKPAEGVKVNRIVNLADDIKLNLAATDVRIEAPVPGKSVVGIEVPNKNAVTVSFRELIDSGEFKASKSLISFAAGRDLGGKIIISDIDKMPHLLIAGATGSGKSVCINTIIMSILYHSSPDDVKFIMVDPKIVELSVYNGIPHLLIPVVTDPKKAAGALMWAVKEMTDRYQKFAEYGVRKIDDFNAKIEQGIIKKTINGETIEIAEPKMPRIVVIVDELADLMMVASSEVEDAITRLTQLARAAGIHLIIATQRPSADVITGVIKANMPSRIAFAVTSSINSRIILDATGAEKLLGKGDMLYYPQGFPQPLRVQGAFVSDDEIAAVCDYLKNLGYENDENSEISEQISRISTGSNSSGSASSGGGFDAADDGRDALFEDAGRMIIETEKASIGMLQRKFKIGFNRAARIMDQLCEAGVVGGEEGTKPRKILMTNEEFESIL